MARRIPTPAPDRERADADQMRRRYRWIELRLCVPAVDIPGKVSTWGPVVTEVGERIQAIGERLRREVADVDDPAERLRLAEAAYLSVFKRLPRGAG